VIPPIAARLPDGRRLHLQHGPIDLIVEVTGPSAVVAEAETAAIARFETILDELVPQLATLRTPPSTQTRVTGSIAHRMVEAVTRFRGVFVTPMVSVADEIRDTIAGVEGVRRAYVNNGGDVAFHLTPGEHLRLGLVPDLTAGGAAHVLDVRAEDLIRGAATSGWGGRSFSFGIADAVTAVATETATADAAATLIANAVDLPAHPAVERTPANELDPDSDLGDRPVTTFVGELRPQEVDEALTRGAEEATRLLRQVPELRGAVLGLRGRYRVIGDRLTAVADPERDVQELADAH
jgi:uncharacterized protein